MRTLRMFNWTPVQTGLAVAGWLGLLIPQQSVSAGGIAPRHFAQGGSQTVCAIGDARLSARNILQGQLVDPAGVAVRGAPLTVIAADRVAGRVVTDVDGRFAVGPLRGGLYRITTGGRGWLVRLWAVGTAPPQAQKGVRLVFAPLVVRGQSSRPVRLSSDAFLLGAMVVAGATIPLVIHGNRSNDRPGS